MYVYSITTCIDIYICIYFKCHILGDTDGLRWDLADIVINMFRQHFGPNAVPDTEDGDRVTEDDDA
jgi:hypothetical protein